MFCIFENMKRLTKTQVESMIDLYLSGKEKNTKELDRIFGVARGSCYFLLKRRNLLKYSYSDAVLKLNQNYFDKIDTEKKAYFLGLIASDGHINKKKNCVTIAIAQNDDKGLLTEFLKELESNNKITNYEDKRTDYKRKVVSSVTIYSEHLKNSLISKGIFSNKTESLSFPKIDEEFQKHFIRGFIDGDGCYFYKRGILHTSIVGTYELLEEMQNIICKQLNCSKNKLIKHKTGVYYLNFAHTNTVKLRNWIYKDCEIAMERKKNMKERIAEAPGYIDYVRKVK